MHPVAVLALLLLATAFESDGAVAQEVPLDQRDARGGLGAIRKIRLRLSTDLSHRIAGYAEAELSAEQEGVYGSYALGALLRITVSGTARFHARLGARIINLVTSLPYADLGAGGELFLTPLLALGLDLSASLPIGDGTRDTGATRWRFPHKADRSGSPSDWPGIPGTSR